MSENHNRPRTQYVALAACLVAMIGIIPFVAAPIAKQVQPEPAAQLLASTTIPGDRTEPTSLATPIVVEVRISDWVKYVDLAIRVLAVLLAWLTGNRPPKPPDSTSSRRRDRS